MDNEAFELGVFFAAWVVKALGTGQVALLVDETKRHDDIGVMVMGVALFTTGLAGVWGQLGGGARGHD